MIIKIGNKIYTKSKDRLNWYGEKIIKKQGYFLREWSPKSSKISAAIEKGLKLDIEDKVILYLGSSTGTTISHLSDLNPKLIIGVDNSPFVMRDFMFLAEKRENIYPLLYDAGKLSNCKFLKNEKFDIVFEDIAVKNLVEIFIENIKQFLKKGGIAMLSLKTRSIDSTKDPKTILNTTISKLKGAGLNIINTYNLEPFEKQHYFIVVENI